MVTGKKISDNEFNLLDNKSRNRILRNRYSAQKTRLNRLSKIKDQEDKIKEQEDKIKKLNIENNELKVKIEFQNKYILLIEKIYNNDLYDYKNNIKKDYSIKLEELELELELELE
tara:strand:- start:1514 stop:1858 length:345 start_codon:yes stop_codon:yes gene_type:complete